MIIVSADLASLKQFLKRKLVLTHAGDASTRDEKLKSSIVLIYSSQIRDSARSKDRAVVCRGSFSSRARRKRSQSLSRRVHYLVQTLEKVWENLKVLINL